MRRAKDVSVAVVATEEDGKALGPLLTELAPQLRRLTMVRPDEVGGAVADVVHAFGWEAGAAARSSGTDGPVLVSPPTLASGRGLPHSDVELETVRRADGVLVASTRQRDDVHQLGVPWYRLTTVPPSVDVSAYARRGPSAPRGDRHRVAAETSSGSGDAGSIFHALRLVDSAELVLFASSGEERHALRAHADAEGVGDRTSFISPETTDERAFWLRSADAVVTVPRTPTDGELALQAMACGSAVVATPMDVLEDVVVHGVTGLHVPPGDGVSLARALRTVLADDFSIESFGMAASDRALHRFSTERVARDLASSYARCAPDPVDDDENENVDSVV